MLRGVPWALNVNELELCNLEVELAERLHVLLKAEEPEGERELEANDKPWGKEQGGQDRAGGDSTATAAWAAAVPTAWRRLGVDQPHVTDARDPAHQAGEPVRLRP